MTHPTTRRALIGGAGLAVVALAAPAACAATAATDTATDIGSDMRALFDACDAAGRACREHVALVFDPLAERTRALTDALPHTVVTIRDKEYSTASWQDRRLANAMVGPYQRSRNAELIRPQRLFLIAAKRRDREEARIRRETGFAAAYERDAELGELWADAEDAICHYPVTTAAQLRAKLAFMVERRLFAGTEWGDTLLADANRLAGVR